MNFSYKQPTEICFGVKKIQELPSIVNRYGKKVLLIGPYLNESIQPMFDHVQEILKEQGIEVTSFFEVEPNPSTLTVEKAKDIVRKAQVDVIVAMGGGSVMDVSKVVGLTYGLEKLNWDEIFETYSSFSKRYAPLTEDTRAVIAIPTTAGTGSQCTQACVITDDKTQMKSTIFHQDSYAKVALIDPELLLTLPPSISASTAFDAFTHAFEAYLRNEDNPWVDYYSLQAIEWIVTYLPRVLKENKVEYRSFLSLADTFGGIALSNSGASLPHPMSEIIGSYAKRLSHGQALALVYPSFIKHTADKYQEKFAEVCAIFDSQYQEDSETAAKEFHLVLERFIQENQLGMKLSDHLDEDSIKVIKEFPLWNHLPMEKTEVIHQIVDEVCKL